MIKPISLLIAGLFVAMYAATAFAHDPKEHEAESAKPDCAAMKNMDVSKMDKNDPVVKAMLQKCQNELNDDGHSEEHSTDDSHHSDDSSAHADTHSLHS